MDIYIAYVYDRHIDPIIKAFTDKQQALSFAEKMFEECVHFPEDIECDYYLDEPNKDGFLAMWSYIESDHAYVFVSKLYDDADEALRSEIE